MIVLNNTAVSGTSCTLNGGADQPFISHGEIFALGDQGYYLTPLIQSRVTASATSGSGAGSSNPDLLQRTIFLRGADVNLTLKATSIETNGQYSVTQNETNVGQFSVLFSGSLPPQGTVNVGFEVITPAIMRNIIAMAGVDPASSSIDAEVLAEVTIKGDLGGDTVSASPFYFPITVCTDCIVRNVGLCPVGAAVSTGNPCNPFQDGVLDCCDNGQGGLVCPAITGQ